MINFFGESYAEFKKVDWPSKEETIRLTGFVIGASLLVGLFVAGIDYIFKELLSIYLG